MLPETSTAALYDDHTLDSYKPGVINQLSAKPPKCSRSISVSMLSSIMKFHHNLTCEHMKYSAEYAKILLNGMRTHRVYANEIDTWDLNTAYFASKLHDIGKIFITNSVLDKPSDLSSSERASINDHPAKGARIIESFNKFAGNNKYLKMAKLFACYHHERWDGDGYPYNLCCEDIPLQGRIMAVADVYDALISERPYKPALSCKDAEEIILTGSGSQFDPQIAEVFYKVKDDFRVVQHPRLII